ncbi:MAG: hypothetical protein GX158_05460 [Bacteroidales bacterium]|nr:hypothetical protein [Bacteroidales bacterium]
MLVLSICHGSRVLVTADLLKSLVLTGTGAIKDEIEQAGATYVDSVAVGNLPFQQPGTGGITHFFRKPAVIIR